MPWWIRLYVAVRGEHLDHRTVGHRFAAVAASGMRSLEGHGEGACVVALCLESGRSKLTSRYLAT